MQRSMAWGAAQQHGILSQDAWQCWKFGFEISYFASKKNGQIIAELAYTLPSKAIHYRDPLRQIDIEI